MLGNPSGDQSWFDTSLYFIFISCNIDGFGSEKHRRMKWLGSRELELNLGFMLENCAEKNHLLRFIDFLYLIIFDQLLEEIREGY